MRQLIVIIFSLICFSGFSQSRPVATIPSPRGDSAFAEYGYIQSLVLGIDAVGDTMIRPRLAGSSRTWIHGGVTEVWKWDGAKWVLTGTSGGSGVGTVTNVSATNTYALSWNITNPTTIPNLTATLDTSLLLGQVHFYNSLDSLVTILNALNNLTFTYVGVGNASNKLSGSSALTYTTGGGLTAHTISNGTGGTDSVLVESGGTVKKISATYYGTGTVSGTLNDSRVVFSADGNVKDTANFVYKRSNGYVGIGVASPLSPLHVQQNSNTPGVTMYFQNINSGTQAQTTIAALNDVGAYGAISSFSANHIYTHLANNGTMSAQNDLYIIGNGDASVGGSTALHMLPGGFFQSEERMRMDRHGSVFSDVTVSALADASSVFELISTERGFLAPRMTAAQRTSISSAATGLLVFDLDSGRYMLKTASSWRGIAFTGESGSSGITALTGDVTASGSGSVAATIAANAVTDAKFRQSVGTSVVGRSANSTGNVADIAGTTDQVLRVNSAGTSLAFGSIDLSKSGTVGSSVLPIANGGTNNGSLSVTAGTIYYGDGSKLVGLAPGASKQHLTGGTTPVWRDTATGGTGTVTKAQIPLLISSGGDSVTRRWNVLDYVGSGYTPGTTDATAAIQAATLACFNGGGGTVFFPGGIYSRYKVSGALQTSVNGVNPNCQIYIPLTVLSSDSGKSITFEGESFTNMTNTVTGKKQATVTIVSTISGSGTIPAVFGSPWSSNINATFVTFKNLSIQTDTASGMSGINGELLRCMNLYNVSIEVNAALGSYNPSAVETYGLIMPGTLNYAMTGGDNILISGYKYGLTSGEHLNIKNLAVVYCYYGIYGKTAQQHPAYIAKYAMEQCTYGIRLDAVAPYVITAYSAEHYNDATHWFSNVYDVYTNPAITNKVTIINAAIGQYAGGIIDSFKTNNWSKVWVASINTNAMISPTIYGGALASDNLTLGSTYNATKGKIFLGANSAFNENTTTLGVGTSSPTHGLHLAGAVATDYGVYVSNTNTGGYAGITAQMGLSMDCGVWGGTRATNGVLAANDAFVIGSGNLSLAGYGGTGIIKFASGGTAERWRMASTGTFSNTGATGTAYIHLKAGTATASTAPIKLTAGVVLTTPESGVIETDANNNIYYSTSTTTDSRGFFELGRYTSSAVDVTATSNMNTIDLTVTGKTVTLPTAVGIQGRIYTIKLTASGSGTVATTSSQTIDGSTTYSLSAQYKYVTVQSNNANWIIIANN